MEARDLEHRPRVLEIELSAGSERAAARVHRTTWRGSTPAVDRIGCAGGTALAAALLYERAPRGAQAGADAPLVIALGDAVRRGLPTAARATVASRSPLTGRFADGQVGGDLARRLASVCDALCIEGSLAGAGHVLVLRSDGSAELERRDELRGLSARDTHVALAARFGPVGMLAIGPAGEAGLAFASLAAGGDPPHFVGRGGLGAVFARTGLKALVVDAPLAEAESDPELALLLASSPRLIARAEGGTLELFGELAARSGELAAARVAEEVANAPGRRHGCRGCPTPCGFEFETPRGAQGARFGAARALGLELGLERFDDALELLAACDRVGADAKEAGAALALLALARERGASSGPRLRGERAALLALIDGLGRPPSERTGDQALLAGGARSAARALGLEQDRSASGGALEAGRGLASLLGQCVSPRGADPMRVFPFLAADAGDARAQAALVAPLPLPEGALDPARPEGKGRLVWWHENWALALDSSGFCAFSAAALLADGGASTGALARRIAPWVHRPTAGRAAGDAEHAAAFLAGGEQVARLIRLLNQCWRQGWGLHWGSSIGSGAPSGDLRTLLDRPGLWPEYAALRGIDAEGEPTAALRADFEAERPVPAMAIVARLDAGSSRPAGSAAERAEPATGRGRVALRSSGPLARALGRERVLELGLPAALDAVLELAAREAGPAALAFFGPGRPPPVVYRAGARLAPGDLVRDGDRLELLLVISGGER